MNELYWLAGLSALGGANLLSVLWVAWRMRSRGIVSTFTAGPPDTALISGHRAHVHEFTTNPGDGKFYCVCGEGKRLGE